MKKIGLLICTMLVLGTVFLHAQTRVSLGTGTGTNSFGRPFGASFGYDRTAALYLSSEIGSTGFITNLNWYVESVAKESRYLPRSI